MTTRHDKAKRWRPRFSLRALIVVVTLACAYLACWRFTATAGVEAVIYHVYGYEIAPIDDWDFNPSTPLPMIVGIDESHSVGLSSIMIQRRYYFWYFVGATPLPFQKEVLVIPEVG
jgi:hypothetical protein